MKAIVYTAYGSPDVLRLQEVERPVPKDGEVVVKVRAASVNALDRHFMRGTPYLARIVTGLRAPKLGRLGVDVAGEVAAVGPGVADLKPGDPVFGTCRGAFAEYAWTKRDRLLPMPAGVSFEEAAAVPIAGFTALQALRDVGKLQAGQKVLIDGAGGGVGGFAVQIAKAFGAEVTAVCGSRNLDTLRAMGADQVLDYNLEDFTRNGQRYDLILGANAFHSLLDYRRALASEGIFVMTGGGGSQMLQAMLLAPLLSLAGSRKLRMKGAKARQQDLQTLKEMLETGKIKPVIDRRYALSETAAAMRHLETGHVRGKIVITVGTL
ncbi:MAG: NAD(P)-dependent alcohol dehydrogenase [Gammaproteobacteria bacterium]